MRRAQQPSWSFRGDLGFPAHAALYVRDALRLDTSADDVAPPALAGVVPDCSGRLVDAARGGAVSAWLGVWHALFERPDSPFVALETLKHPPFDPSLWDEAVRWANGAKRATAGPDPGGPIPWRVVNDAVTALARDAGVDPGRLHGAAEYLLVRGRWWRLLRPGLVVCSVEAASDPIAAAQLLRAALVSGLEA